MHTLGISGIHDNEALVRSVANMTYIGALADDVVLDALRVQAGHKAGGESLALKSATEMLSHMVALRPSVSNMWDGNDAVRAFAHISHFDGSADTSESSSSTGSSNGAKAFVQQIRDALAAIQNSSATPGQFKLVIDIFERISNSTLAAAQESTEARSPASQWVFN